MIPDVDLPNNINQLLSEPFYEIENFKVADLLAKNTIDGYINIGEFFCMSIGSDDNLKFSLSQKKLTLEIDQDVYYSLGAINLSKFQKTTNNQTRRFEIDLSYHPQDKVRNELISELLDKVRIYFVWHPSAKDVCPSSAAKYFADMGYVVKGCKNLMKLEHLYGLKMPLIPMEINSNEEEITAFSEHIGMILLGCDMATIEENFKGQSMLDVGRGKVVHCKGLITCNQLNEVIKALQEIVSDASFPYIVISSIPFNSTVNCGPRTIIITPEDYLILQ